MKKVNSFILPDNIIRNMRDEIKKTKKTKIEHGFALCKDKDSVITKGTECIGTRCTIMTGRCLKENQTYIGNYHTHPRTWPTMSVLDMIVGCEDEIECVGSAPFNSIRCFTRKTDKSQCLDEVSALEDVEYDLIKRGKEIRKVLRSPRSVIKKGIRKFLKEISSYDKDTAKYHRDRVKLLNKNFNRTDIKRIR